MKRLELRIGEQEARRPLVEVVQAMLSGAGLTQTATEALRRGAVFVDRRRASAGVQLKPGQSVTLTLPAEGATELSVLHEDADVVVVAKPPGISSIPDQSDRSGSLLGRIEERYGPGLHLLGRLDREVTGIVVALRTERARRQAVELRAAGQISRAYVAVICPAPDWNERVLDEPIGRHPTQPRLRRAGGAGAVPARTEVSLLQRLATSAALVEARPITGRTHQIRVHLSHAGHPIAGDRAYGGPRRLTLPDGRVLACPRVMLHAARLSMPHPGGQGRPGDRERLEIAAPWPADLEALVAALRVSS